MLRCVAWMIRWRPWDTVHRSLRVTLVAHMSRARTLSEIDYVRPMRPIKHVVQLNVLTLLAPKEIEYHVCSNVVTIIIGIVDGHIELEICRLNVFFVIATRELVKY